MRLHWLSICIVGLSGMLAGCAPTVWTRPGTTIEEANFVQARCADVAASTTPSSNTRFGGRQTVLSILAAGALDIAVDGFRQESAKSDCMTRLGFTPQRATPATVQTAYAAAAPAPSSPEAPVLLASFPVPNPTTLNPAATAISSASIHADPIRLAPQPPPIDRRQVLTQDLMRLPDRSRTKAAFLLGACSAGDMSACVLSNIYNPKSTNLN